MVKNIVVLSDGTGNSSASRFKTNVWRLYQAIDITDPDPGSGLRRQIVYYDDGVGTENFKPLAAIGGAFGVGVWRNVKDLYTFVCRNYDDGDQIYGFGFSRGAFTIRLLMGLIGKCGVVKAESESKLVDCVQMAYEAYRRDFLIRASRRRRMIYHRILRPPRYVREDRQLSTIDLSSTGCRQLFPDIRFVGVWDTVDAYGMPVDELKIAIDRWVWPMSFADRNPSKRLRTIRHALSLDDERPTFRPVLWNEVVNDPAIADDQRDIQQVWFAGVHANVGGGYPDDGLACSALAWMMAEAGLRELRYDDLLRDEILAHVNPHGEHYDSRAGIAGYYRYGPRKVDELCNDKTHNVHVPCIRVHQGAYARIAECQRGYAPVSLAGGFRVGNKDVPAPDAQALANAWDFVWWRRVAYFTTLALTGFASLFAVGLVWPAAYRVLALTEGWLRGIWSLVPSSSAGWLQAGWNWIVGHIGWVAGWATAFAPALQDYALTAIVTGLLLAWCFFRWSVKLDQRIEAHAEWAWAGAKGLSPSASRPQPNWHNAVARRLRPITTGLYRLAMAIVIPLLGIVLGLVALVVFSPVWLRTVFQRTRPWMAESRAAPKP